MGGMYKSPLAGDQVKVENDFTVSWDTSCMNPADDSVNISLYNMNTTSTDAHVHTWAEISWSRGSYTVRSFPLSRTTGSWPKRSLIDVVIHPHTVQNRPHMVRKLIQSVPPDQHPGQLYTPLHVHWPGRSYLLGHIRRKGCARCLARITFCSRSYAYVHLCRRRRDNFRDFQMGDRP